ncbi:hypothetical protein [Streptomyces sp. NPDC059092]|uniref:hypothetical protein n=1 Tax=Streptomyces sp. NPDC059092 TaxID=3346725 RepID=UPI00369E168A
MLCERIAASRTETGGPRRACSTPRPYRRAKLRLDLPDGVYEVLATASDDALAMLSNTEPPVKVWD